jgi:hypothetical protein
MNMERLERNGRTRKVPLNANSFGRPAKQATTKSLAGLACRVWGLVLSAYLDVADKNLHLEICWIRRAMTSLFLNLDLLKEFERKVQSSSKHFYA